MIRSPIFTDTDSFLWGYAHSSMGICSQFYGDLLTVLWGSVHSSYKGSGFSLGDNVRYLMSVYLLLFVSLPLQPTVVVFSQPGSGL